MSLNKAMLIGNVGKEPEIRYIAPDQPVATVVIATNNPAYTTKDGTTIPESAEWHTIILWNQLAKIAEQYIHKGDKIFVEGEIRTRTYTDRAGISHTRPEIWARKLELFSKSQPQNL